MNKMQKIGFFGSAAVFFICGLVFLFFGYTYDDRTLRLMGLTWTPLSVLYMIGIAIMILNDKGKIPKIELKKKKKAEEVEESAPAEEPEEETQEEEQEEYTGEPISSDPDDDELNSIKLD